MTKNVFGSYFADLRRQLDLSLPEFCRINGFDPSNVSKLERGKIPPPRSRRVLDTFAEALGLREGSDEWFEFYDRAAAARCALPDSVTVAPDAVECLPVLYGILRDRTISAEDVGRMIAFLTEAP